MDAKFYIYARGRWCELDTRSGRVEGWKERARFLYFKGGKLELARTARVLRGLRALVAGTPGSVLDGPPLPQRRRRRRRRSRRERDSRHRSHHHNCCVHHRCDLNAGAFTGHPALAAPAAPLPLPPPPLTPRRRRIISSEEEPPKENIDKSPVKKESPKITRRIVVSRSGESSSGESSSDGRKRVTRSGKKFRHDTRVVDSDSSKVKSRRETRSQKQEVISISDDSQEKLKRVEGNKKIASKAEAEKILLGLSGSEDLGRQSEDSEPAKELVIDEEDVTVLRRFLAKRGIGNLDKFDNDEEYKRRVFYKLNPLVMLQRYKPLENLLRQKMTLKEFARNLGLRSVAEVTPEKRYRMRASTKLARAAGTDSETDKENIVKPKRRKLWNNDKELFNSVTSRSSEVKPRQIPKPVLNEDSSKDTTDSDTEFKRKVREQLAKTSKQRATAERGKETTSVEEREQRTTRSSLRGPGPLANQNIPSADTRNANAPRLESSEGIRRTRSSDRGLRVPPGMLKEQNKASDSSDSAFENKPTSPKKPESGKVPKVSNNAALKRDRKGRFLREGEGKVVAENVDKMAAGSARKSVMAVKPIKVKNSSVPAGREYTSLEDHAIIAWVSTGGRERRVNGNALWRELAAHYHGITGQTRSWHSLRNRYLRYLLPALGRLALPPAQVSRLRAAAAAGVMKVGSVHQRRNSIFGAPAVRSASGAARAQPSAGERGAPAPAEAQRTSPRAPGKPAAASPRSPRRVPPPPSPTYSAVTRRFRTRDSTPLTPAPAPAAPARTIKRKAKKW